MSRKPKSIRHRALDLLARREHSRLELARKLKQREFTFQEIEPCLDQLQADDLLSNERFANAYARMRSCNGFGPERILRELVERGIDDYLASQALRNLKADWLTNAREVRSKKYGDQPSQDFAERVKQARFLNYRGFSHDIINIILGER